MKLFSSLLLMAAGGTLLLGCGNSGSGSPVNTTGGGTKAVSIMTALTAMPRDSGSESEALAGDYIIEFYRGLGLEPDIQSFNYDMGGTSRNICVSLPGNSDRTLILGAHYDSIQDDESDDGESEVNTGATDNASSNGVLMTMVELLVNQRVTPQHNLVVCSWGAEEIGLHGSDFYADNMTATDVANTVAYINIDTIGVGDILYAYAGREDTGWLRDYTIEFANEIGVPLTTQPGENPNFAPAGYTCDCSDHVGFQNRRISVVYLEATNWQVDEPDCPKDGFCQTEQDGRIIHTGIDNLSYLLDAYPGRFSVQLQQYLDVVVGLVLNIVEPAEADKLIPMSRSVGGDPTATQRYRDLYKRVSRSSIQEFDHKH